MNLFVSLGVNNKYKDEVIGRETDEAKSRERKVTEEVSSFSEATV